MEAMSDIYIYIYIFEAVLPRPPLPRQITVDSSSAIFICLSC
jgi:hypothetical protein